MSDQKRASEQLHEYFQGQKNRKLRDLQLRNQYIKKGQILFTGSSLAENFPITEFCVTEGLPIVYNRGIGGYTSDEFLAAIDTVLLDPQPSKLFINIGTNDIREWPGEADWLDHLSRNYRKICQIIQSKLPHTSVYMMAYYPCNEDVMKAKPNPIPSLRSNHNLERASRMVEQLAGEFGFHYIEVNEGLKDNKGMLKAEMTVDGIHFDASGYKIVFEHLKPYILAKD